MLRHRHCVGILGGRPNHAIYFTGYRGDCLLGLDPHTVFPNPPRPPAPPISGVGAGVYPPPDIPLGCLSASASTTSAGASCNAGAKNRTSSTDRGGTGDSAAAGADCSNNKRTRSAGYSWESVDPTNHYTSKTTTGLSHNKQQLGLNTTYSSHDSNSCSSSTSTSTSTSESYFSSAFSFGANMSDSDSATATAAAFPTAEYLSQVHVPEFVTLDFSRLDPSMAVGFYFPDRAEFERFCEENRVLTARKVKEGKTPLFTVQNAAPAYMYSDAQEYGGSGGKNFGGGGGDSSGGGDGGGDGGGESVGKCGSFDPSDVDDHFEGGAVGAGAGSGRARRVPRVVSAEDSSDDDYVLV